jgi:hypothetical protein
MRRTARIASARTTGGDVSQPVTLRIFSDYV